MHDQDTASQAAPAVHVVVSDATADAIAEMIETWGRSADPSGRYYRDSTVELAADILGRLGIATVGMADPAGDVAEIIESERG